MKTIYYIGPVLGVVAIVLSLSCVLINPDKPRIDPTLEALVRERAIESLYTEYESAIYEMIGAVSNPAILRFYLGPKDEYVAAYVATECVHGRELDTSAFRSFVQLMFRDRREGEPSPLSVHSMGIFKILLDKADMKIGPVSENCMKPYTYPSTVNEARLTSNLLRIFRIESVAPSFYDAARNQYDNWALGWVSNKDRGNRPLLPWICYEELPEICPKSISVLQN